VIREKKIIQTNVMAYLLTLVGKLPYDVNKSLTCFIIEGNNFLQFLLPKNLNIVLIC